MVATDVLVAPAFPSNTARSGVLYPIVNSLACFNGSYPWEESRQRIGAYLMMTSMAGLGLSSALWLTAMAANPVGVAIAAGRGFEITFDGWFLASSVPEIASMSTPQGSSANVIFMGSGYLTGSEVYRCGGVVTGVFLAVYLILGTPWMLLVL
ncbi:MAG: anion permease [Gammaproteobacteria bacterium]|jgi:di/tricarboxylate transporter|nr:anion permease [Gammaproteobacteria bacterium]